ncbi:hypothetical protein [Algoriphagus formosus]|uniref:hypothetical protein n=1 Tax=Algoriphagus formosus TaxID=2007308 RepID=UPI003F7303E7
MAKNKENLDTIFRENLENHEVKPSRLAWERLENQLPTQEKESAPFVWWAVAAAVVLLLAVGSLLRSTDSPIEVQNLLSEEITEPSSVETPPVTIVETEEAQKTDEKESSTEIIQEEESPRSDPKPTVKKEFQTPQNLIAQAETEIEEPKVREELPEIRINKEVELPSVPTAEINQGLLIAEAKPVEEPAYRVTIISDGIKEDKNLIADIGRKVNQVEGLLGKVDEGFANLQDAKNNLFTALVTRKEKVTEE